MLIGDHLERPAWISIPDGIAEWPERERHFIRDMPDDSGLRQGILRATLLNRV
jgi:hypothetical protein